jgi:hypothetical protein
VAAQLRLIAAWTPVPFAYDEISQRSGSEPLAGRHTAVWSADGSAMVCNRQLFQSDAGTIASRPAFEASAATGGTVGAPALVVTVGDAPPDSPCPPAVR